MRRDVKETILYMSKRDMPVTNKAELARRFNCDPRTIDRYIKLQNGELKPTVSKRVYSSKLDGYKNIIINKVDNYGCTAMAVYKLIEKKGYTGKYSTVADFIKRHKEEEKKNISIRFESSPGVQAQVDWKEDMVLVNREGKRYKINIFLMILGYSRYRFIKITKDRSQPTLFNCMAEAFKFFEGLPQEILFDNMSTVVDQSRTSFTGTVFEEEFERYANRVGFKPIACKAYRPQTKGKVESLAKLMERLRAYNEEFDDWDDLMKINIAFMEEINKEVSKGSGEAPIKLYLEEKKHLAVLPKDEILYNKKTPKQEKKYKVNKDSMIEYRGKMYSVPTTYIGECLTVKQEADGGFGIYKGEKLIERYGKGDRKYNYSEDTAYTILKNDAMKDRSDEEILYFIRRNLSPFE